MSSSSTIPLMVTAKHVAEPIGRNESKPVRIVVKKKQESPAPSP